MEKRLLVLPGMNPNLREWSSEVSTAIGSLFDSSIVHEYTHWTDPSHKFSFENEIDRIRRIDLADASVFLFAKSIGCLLSLVAVDEGVIDPEAAILVGFPLSLARQNDFPVEDQLYRFKVKTLFIQNTADPASSAEELSKLLEAHMQANYKLVELPRDDHHYPDMAGMRTEISRFLKD